MKLWPAIFLFAITSAAGLFDVPVRPQVRNSLVQAESWVDVQSPNGTEVLGLTGSAITGWGFPIGTPTNWSRVTFPLRASVDGRIPTDVRVRVRQGDYTGTVLADRTQAIALDIGIRRIVSVEFTNTIANAGSSNLWMEVLTDGRIDEYQSSATVWTTPTARYWTDGNVASPTGSPLASVTDRNYPVTIYRSDNTVNALQLSGSFSAYVNGSSLISRIATARYGLDASKEIGEPGAVNLWSASTFSGSGQLIGSVTNANAFGFYLYAWDESALPTQVRLRIREMPADTALWTNNPATWTVVATKTVDVSPAASAFTRVDVVFGDDVSLTGTYWLEYVCNGKDRGREVDTGTHTPVDPPGLWYVTGSSLESLAWTKSVSARSFYVEIGRGSTDLAGYTVTDEFKRQLGGVPSTASAVLTMARTYYAREGVEANVYFDNIVRSTAPLESLCVDILGSKGAQFGSFGGFWRFTPSLSDTGSVSMSTVVLDPLSGAVLATNSWTLVTTRTNHPAVPVARRLVAVGDSTLGGSGAAVLAELVRIFSGNTNYSLTLEGSNDGTFNDSLGVSRTVRCEAISGWSSAMLSTNSATAWTEIGGTSRTGSPFVHSGVFNLTNWASTYGVTVASNDWVLIHLGINDVFAAATDVSASAAAESCAGYIDSMVAAFRSLTPGVRVVVCSTIPPNASQDGFGSSYGVGQNRQRYKRNRDILNERLRAKFVDRTASKIHFLDYGASLDSVNNYSVSATVANSRSAVAWNKATAGSGVHPDPTGYHQLADTIAAFLEGNE